MIKKKLELFDANCMLGIAPGDQGGSFDTIEDIRVYMDRYDISKTLVYSAMAKYYSPIEGDLAIQQQICDVRNVYSCWMALPSATGEFPAGDALRTLLRDHCVAAVRMAPVTHDYSLALWNCHPLFLLLEELQMPLFLDFDLGHWSDRLPWNDVHQICTTYPRLPVILCRVGCGYNRNLFKLMETCDNLYFETSYFAANRGLETVTRLFGAQRMLFGTDAPVHTPACPIGMLVYSDLLDEQKQAIAKGNLERLIGGVCHD